MSSLYRKLIPVFVLLFTSLSGIYGQTALWVTVSENDIQNAGERRIIPNDYKVVAVDLNVLKRNLVNAPDIKQTPVKNSKKIVSIPMPDGSIVDFKTCESSIMHPDLAAKFPEINTYTGIGINDGRYQVIFDITAYGFHAMVFTPDGIVFIDPYQTGDTEHYIVYYKHNFEKQNKPANYCSFDQHNKPKGEDELFRDILQNNQGNSRAGDCQLRTYRLALACTGEYATFHGGTTLGAMSAMNTSMARVNFIYERECAITMVLVANNNLLIYLNAATDPYTNSNGGTMLGQNQSTCNAVIGSANYDIGHVFSTGGGGVAYLNSPCNASTKAGGVTGQSSPVGDPFDIDYVAHEMGHQYGGNHTQNNSCNRNGSTAMEPGSASSIMGYAGICAPNVQSNSDALFHAISLQEIAANVTTGISSSCPVVTNTPNNAPVMNTGTSSYTIPVLTPFVLTRTATDPDGDSLTYTWDQMNAQVATMPPAATNTSGPAFRCILPVPSPSRYFPNLNDVINNVSPVWEVLSSVTRSYNFRATVRDNNPGSGCTDEENVTINVSAVAGPFVVTNPNTNVTLNALSSEIVTWNVAGSSGAPVNCANVNILLSVDGGLTFPITLASNTANDGTQSVTIPNNQTTTARVKVEAVNNVFYDMSNTNFTITAPSNPDYTLSVTPASQEICASNNAVYNIDIGSILGYNNAVTLSVSGNPTGSTVNFSTNPVTPTGSAVLTIGNTGAVTAGTYNFTLNATSLSGPKSAALQLVLFDGIPTFPVLTSPLNTSVSIPVSTTFSWTGSILNDHIIQIATDAGFSSIYIEDSNINATTYNNVPDLSPSTTYYWRVKAGNFCGESSWSPVFSFTTESCPAITFPLTEDAESLANCLSTCTGPAGGCTGVSNGWTNTQTGDDTDWSITSGGTPSTNTGPSVDHTTGNTSGSYYYTEATSPCNASSQEAFLVRQCIDLNSLANPAVSFWYHMYGAGMGTLNIDVYHNGSWTLGFWSVSGQQQTSNGAAWTNQIVNLTSFLSTGGIVDIRFRGVIGGAFTSDMAIDDISIYDSSQPPVAAFSADKLVSCPGTPVVFTDESAQSPTGWIWSATPGTYGFVNSTNMNSQNPQISFSASGLYSIQLIVQNSFGSDTIIKSNYIDISNGTAIPQVEGFQSGTFAPAGWSIASAGGAYTWQQSAPVTGNSGTSTIAAYVQNYSYNAPGNEDGLISLPIDLTGINTAWLTFDVAYARYDATLFDGLRIDVSADCGETFTPSGYFKEGTALETVGPQTSSWFPNSAVQWRTDSVDLSAVTGGTVVLKFVNVNGYGNNLFIDNINIDGSFVCIGPIVDNINATNISCFGGNNGMIDLMISSGTGPYSFAWSHGSTAQDQSNLSPGVYTVLVTDDIGCTATASTTITQPSQLGITTSKNNVSCNNVNNGTASVAISGGTGPYSYLWNTNPLKTTSAINGLGGGDYTCSVTDNNSCTATASVSVFNPNAIIAFTLPNNPSPGDVNLLVSGGVNPYTYNWSNGVTTEDLTGVAPGFYFCQVSDRNGCAKIATINLAPPQSPQLNNNGTITRHSVNSVLELNIYPTPSAGIIDIGYYLNCNGRVLLDVFDITGRTIRKISSQSSSGYHKTQIDLTELSDGIYYIRIKVDQNEIVKKVIIAKE